MHRSSVVFPRHPAALILALAVALWLASTLGLVHRTLHVPGLNPPATLQSATPASLADVAASAVVDSIVKREPLRHAPHGLAVLFGDHSDADCRLYDQLAHGTAMPAVPFVALPVSLPAATFAWLQGEIFARWVALLRARGPPSAR